MSDDSVVSDEGGDVTEQIVARGREVLLAALRPEVQEAARQQSDLVRLDEHQLEEIVLRAAQQADGTQWRWALATVASEELGIDLGEAISHPVVEQAHQLAGAPPYDLALAEPDPQPAESESQPGEPALAAGEPALAAGEPNVAPGEPESQPVEVAAPDSDVVSIIAVHRSGIANLSPDEEGLELRISDEGLDIYRAEHEPFGRLVWTDIKSLAIGTARGRRRRKQGGAQLALTTSQGEAIFSIPAVNADELRAHLTPLLERYGPR